jgi:hypothetical protein
VPQRTRSPQPTARRVHGDDGQLMAALVIGLAITLLAFCVIALLPIGAATNDATRSQTAADAAALAGLERTRGVWVDEVTAPGRIRFVPGVAVGLGGLGARPVEAAESYAERNDADLVQFSRSGGRVEVRVRNQYTSHRDQDRRAESGSVAETSTDLDTELCRWVEPLVPPVLPFEEGGPPNFEATLRCGDWEATYRVSNSSATYWETETYGTGSSRNGLYRDLEPRLVD